MKGYVRCSNGKYLLIQSVFDLLEIQVTDNWTGPTEIILMGPGVRPGPFTKEFLNTANDEK